MRYHNITHDDMKNGSGLRVVLWVSACSHKCEGCHNPQTWNPCSGVEFDLSAKQEIFNQLDNDYISGITFSGGDPLHENNTEAIKLLIEEIKIKYPNKNIWLYTGYTYRELESIYPDKFEVVNLCDVLVDGEFDQELADINYPWAGSTNQRVINLKESLKTQDVVLYK